MLPSQRKKLHQLVAEYYELHHSKEDKYLPLILHHYSKADKQEKVTYYQQQTEKHNIWNKLKSQSMKERRTNNNSNNNDSNNDSNNNSNNDSKNGQFKKTGYYATLSSSNYF